MIEEKKKVGRPRKAPQERGEIIPIRLNDYYKQGISNIGRPGFAANVRFLFDEYVLWEKAKREIHKKIEDRSRIFIQSFSLFVEASKDKRGDEAAMAKEKVLRSAIELKFLSDLLFDSHQFLKSTQGNLNFRHLQDVWKVAKID